MFLINAQLNLDLSKGATSKIKSELQSVIGGVKGNVDITVSSKSKQDIAELGKNLKQLESTIRTLSTETGAASSNISKFTNSLGGITKNGKETASTLNATVTATKALSNSFSQASTEAEKFGHQVGLAFKRFGAFTVATAGLFTLVRGLRNASDEAVRFDLQINKLRQVADDGSRGVESLKNTIQDLAKNLGVSSSQLAEAATAFTQAGLSAKDSAKAVEAFGLALLSPNFGNAKNTIEGMIALYQQFGKDADKLKGQLGAINAVAGAFASEAEDLVTAIQKAGGVFSETGGKLEELLGIMTSVRATTRESADSIATGLRSIFTYVQRTETVDTLKQLNINLRRTTEEAKALGDIDLAEQFVGPYEAIQRLSAGLAKLRSTDPRYSQIVEDLGGVRQVSRVLPLIKQFAEAQKAVNVARVGSASIETAAAIRQDALITKLTKVRETYQQLANDLVQSRGFKELANVLTDVATKFADVARSMAPLLPVLTGLAIGQIGKFALNASSSFIGTVSGRTPVLRRSTGGPVPGQGNGDTVPAYLEPQEFIIKKASAKKLGQHKLNYLNEHGELPGYAEGGYYNSHLPVSSVHYVNVRQFGTKVNTQLKKHPPTVRSIVEKIHDLGIDPSLLTSGIALNYDNPKLYGGFNTRTKGIVINNSALKRDSKNYQKDYQSVLSHEFGHGLSDLLSRITGGLSVTQDEKSPEFGRISKLLSGIPDVGIPSWDSSEEKFADLFGSLVSGVASRERRTVPLSNKIQFYNYLESVKKNFSFLKAPKLKGYASGGQFEGTSGGHLKGIPIDFFGNTVNPGIMNDLDDQIRGSRIGLLRKIAFGVPEPDSLNDQRYDSFSFESSTGGNLRSVSNVHPRLNLEYANSLRTSIRRAIISRYENLLTDTYGIDTTRPGIFKDKNLLNKFKNSNLFVPGGSIHLSWQTGLKEAFSKNENGFGDFIRYLNRKDLTRYISKLVKTDTGRSIGNRNNIALFKAFEEEGGLPGFVAADELEDQGHSPHANLLRSILEAGQKYKRYASGGPVFGGIPGKDSVNARLMPEEFVIKASSAKKIGHGALDYINKTGELPKGFTDGGSPSTQDILSPKPRAVFDFQKTIENLAKALGEGVDSLTKKLVEVAQATNARLAKIHGVDPEDFNVSSFGLMSAVQNYEVDKNSSVGGLVKYVQSNVRGKFSDQFNRTELSDETLDVISKKLGRKVSNNQGIDYLRKRIEVSGIQNNQDSVKRFEDFFKLGSGRFVPSEVVTDNRFRGLSTFEKLIGKTNIAQTDHSNISDNISYHTQDPANIAELKELEEVYKKQLVGKLSDKIKAGITSDLNVKKILGTKEAAAVPLTERPKLADLKARFKYTVKPITQLPVNTEANLQTMQEVMSAIEDNFGFKFNSVEKLVNNQYGTASGRKDELAKFPGASEKGYIRGNFAAKKGAEKGTIATYSGLNKNQLVQTMIHELGHAFDLMVGGNDLGSLSGNKDIKSIIDDYSPIRLKELKKQGVAPEKLENRMQTPEVFAEAFKAFMNSNFKHEGFYNLIDQVKNKQNPPIGLGIDVSQFAGMSSGYKDPMADAFAKLGIRPAISNNSSSQYEGMSIREVARLTGVPRSTLQDRLKKGMSIDQAVAAGGGGRNRRPPKAPSGAGDDSPFYGPDPYSEPEIVTDHTRRYKEPEIIQHPKGRDVYNLADPNSIVLPPFPQPGYGVKFKGVYDNPNNLKPKQDVYDFSAFDSANPPYGFLSEKKQLPRSTYKLKGKEFYNINNNYDNTIPYEIKSEPNFSNIYGFNDKYEPNNNNIDPTVTALKLAGLHGAYNLLKNKKVGGGDPLSLDRQIVGGFIGAGSNQNGISNINIPPRRIESFFGNDRPNTLGLLGEKIYTNDKISSLAKNEGFADYTNYKMQNSVRGGEAITFRPAGANKSYQQSPNLEVLRGTSVFDGIQQKQYNESISKLTEGINRQLRALNLNISAIEREKAAHELAVNAYNTNQEFVSNKAGEAVGLKSLQGGRLGYIDRAFNFIDDTKAGIGKRLSGVKDRFSNTFIGRGISNIGQRLEGRGTQVAIGLSTAASFGADALSPNRDALTSQVQSGDESTYRNKAVGSGALQGAAIGASIGLAAGPYGAIAGGLIGGLVGLTSALKQARIDIENAKIDVSIQKIGESLKYLSSGKESLSSINEADLVQNIRQIRLSAYGIAAEQVGYKNPGTLQAENQKQLRIAFGGQAGNLAATLAEEINRESKKEGATVESVFGSFQGGSRKTILDILSEIRGLSKPASDKELKEDIRLSIDNAKSLKANQVGEDQIRKLGASFERLSSSVSNAASKTNDFKDALEVIGGSSGSVFGLTNKIDQFGVVGSKDFDQGISGVSKLLGSSGNKFVETLSAANKLQAILPEILSDVASQGFDEKETVSSKIYKLLESKVDTKNPEIAGGISVIMKGLAEEARKNNGDTLRDAKVDPSLLAKQLIAPYSGAAFENVNRIAKDFQGEFNFQLTGNENLKQRRQESDYQRSRGFDLALNTTRSSADILAEQLGGGGGGRLLSYQQLLSPFTGKQNSLLSGLGISNIEDPNEIKNKLTETLAARENAKTKINEAAIAGDSSAVKKATENFSKLGYDADRLQKALQNLIDPTQKLAAIQERLSHLREDEESRLSFGERFINADGNERQNIVRGQRLVAQLASDPSKAGERFLGLSNDNQRLALREARSIGQGQFQNGLTGNSLANLLIRSTGISSSVNDKEKNFLLGEKAKTDVAAGQANNSLSTVLETQNQNFKNNLDKSFKTFLKELSLNLLKVAQLDATNKFQSADAATGNLKTQSRQAELLRSVGIGVGTTAEQVDNSYRIGSSEQAKTALDKFFSARDEFLPYQERDINKYQDSINKVASSDLAKKPGAKPNQIANELDIPNELKAQVASYLASRKGDSIATIMSDGGLLGERTYNQDQISRAIKEAYDKVRQGKEDNLGLAGQNIRAFGYNTDTLSTLNDNQIKSLKLALEAFKSDSLSSLPQRIGESNKALDELRKSAEALKEQFNNLSNKKDASLFGIPISIKKSGGGSIFQARGSDTVPAMLTPEEFVVNAASAKANRGLLEKINNARGAVYLAKGGRVGYPKQGGKGVLPTEDDKRNAFGLVRPEAPPAKDDFDPFAVPAPNGFAPYIPKDFDKREGNYTNFFNRRRNALADYNDFSNIGLDRIGKNNNTWRKIQAVRNNRQIGSLLLQQAMYGTEDEIYQSGIDRLRTQDSKDLKRFDDRFGSIIRSEQQKEVEKFKQNNNKRVFGFDRKNGGKGRGVGKNVFWNSGPVGFLGDKGQFVGFGSTKFNGFGPQVEPGPVSENKGGTRTLFGIDYNKIGFKKFASGGVVTGGIPGQDSVPSLLTPGEIVLPNKGGTTASDKMAEQNNKLATSINSFVEPASKLTSSFTVFAERSDALIAALDRFPREVTHTGSFEVNATITGAEAFSEFGRTMEAMVDKKISQSLSQELERRFPEAPNKLKSDPTNLG